jgi:hypothetical protein
MSNKNKKWHKSEEDFASKFNCKTIGFSGGKWPRKEDFENENIIGQAKSTQGKSISIKLQTIHDLFKRCIVQHKMPVLAIDFINCEYADAQKWVAIPINLIDDEVINLLINKWEENYESEIFGNAK